MRKYAHIPLQKIELRIAIKDSMY